jgi:heme/copper-type cytochrome/quinol oxidase subunit 2
MDQTTSKLVAVMLVLSFFIPKVLSQTSGATPEPPTYPTEEEYIRSLRLELRWIMPSYVMAIAGAFFMTLAMIFLFLRGRQLRRSPGCGRGCSPGWSFCCIIPIIVIITLLITEMAVISSPGGLMLLYLELVVTNASKNPTIGIFFVLLMIYAVATFISLVIFVVFAIKYANGRKKRQVKAVVKLSRNFASDAQRTFQSGSTTVVHEGNKEWAVIDLGRMEDDSTLGTTTSSSPDSDDELQEASDQATSTSTQSTEAAEGSMGSRFRGLY